MRLYLLLFILGIFACSKKVQQVAVKDEASLSSYPNLPAVDIREENGLRCTDRLSYAPDEHYDERIIRVNVHFTCSKDGKVGFNKEEGKTFMYNLLENANKRMHMNEKMNLPVNNSTPVLEPKYRYQLTPATDNPGDTGYYWHYDDELYYFVNKGANRNNYNSEVLKKYENSGDSILHLFIMPHHPDSVKSKTYKAHGTGIALGNSLKMAGLYENKDRPWEYATLLNHEVGHIPGLAHSWTRNDGCDDTPKHGNCWKSDKSKSGCEVASNNVMDYNNSQMAFTPCQLGIVHRGFAKLGSKTRKFLVPTWCKLDLSKDIVIDGDEHWYGARDLGHNVVVNDGASLHIHCRVSLPKGATIEVQPGGTLILDQAQLHNDCGDKWAGIKLLEKGSKVANFKTHGSVKIEDVE